MKKVLMSVLFGGALIVTSQAFAQTTPTAPMVDTTAPAAHPHHEHEHEHHPEIRRAMLKLRHAKEDLQKAAHDYGGHRVAAIGYIDQALAELHQALTADKQ